MMWNIKIGNKINFCLKKNELTLQEMQVGEKKCIITQNNLSPPPPLSRLF